MEKDINKKRLLYLMQYIYEQTDEQHPTTIIDIIDCLRKKNIESDRKTIKADIDFLTEMGMDIIVENTRPVKYFAASRRFELPELKLLIDAVQASRSITKKKSRQLIEKISSLASIHQAKALKTPLYVPDAVKPTNEKIFINVFAINQAIAEKKQLEFKYYEYTSEKKKVLKHGGRIYVFYPYSLMWNHDYYYAVGYSVWHHDILSFRIDRMTQIHITDGPWFPAPNDFDISDYSNKIFNMFSGEETFVTLKCSNELMKSVINRFGEKINTVPLDEKYFETTVKVCVSPTFYAWVFQFAGDIRITAPDNIVKEYREMCDK